MKKNNRNLHLIYAKRSKRLWATYLILLVFLFYGHFYLNDLLIYFDIFVDFYNWVRKNK